MHDMQKMVSLVKNNSPFCNAKTVISVRQSKSLENKEIGKQFAPLCRIVAEQLKTLFPVGDDDDGAFIHCPSTWCPFTSSQH